MELATFCKMLSNYPQTQHSVRAQQEYPCAQRGDYSGAICIIDICFGWF